MYRGPRIKNNGRAVPRCLLKCVGLNRGNGDMSLTRCLLIPLQQWLIRISYYDKVWDKSQPYSGYNHENTLIDGEYKRNRPGLDAGFKSRVGRAKKSYSFRTPRILSQTAHFNANPLFRRSVYSSSFNPRHF